MEIIETEDNIFDGIEEDIIPEEKQKSIVNKEVKKQFTPEDFKQEIEVKEDECFNLQDEDVVLDSGEIKKLPYPIDLYNKNMCNEFIQYIKDYNKGMYTKEELVEMSEFQPYLKKYFAGELSFVPLRGGWYNIVTLTTQTRETDKEDEDGTKIASEEKEKFCIVIMKVRSSKNGFRFANRFSVSIPSLGGIVRAIGIVMHAYKKYEGG